MALCVCMVELIGIYPFYIKKKKLSYNFWCSHYKARPVFSLPTCACLHESFGHKASSNTIFEDIAQLTTCFEFLLFINQNVFFTLERAYDPC